MFQNLKWLCGSFLFLSVAISGALSMPQILREGVLRSRGALVNRLENPITFWTCVVFGFFGITVLAILGVLGILFIFFPP